jgi:hypothetical protein
MDELSVDQIAGIRSWIRGAVQAGHPMSVIDAKLREKYPKINADQVMRMSGQDFARSLGQGLTLGHVDELAGMVAKAQGKDYTTARDAMRNQDAQAKAANPKMSGAVTMLAGAIPGALSSMIPGLAPEAGATMLNAGKMAVQGGLVGGTAGAGASTAATPGGVVSDAVKTAIPSAVLGGVGGAVASRFADAGLPTGSAGRVTTEGAGLLPNRTPDEIMHIVSRQEAMAPGTTVAADISPEMQTLARGVGADLKTAMKARVEAEGRFRTLTAAKKTLGASYDTMLGGNTGPVDPQLVTAIAATGRKGVIAKGATSVDLLDIHQLRSDILGQIRETKNPARQYDLRQQAQGLTDWLTTQMPQIKGLDSDYAFLSQRTAVAKQTMNTINKSASSYGTDRAYGIEPGSAGGSLPGTPLPGGSAGVVIKTVGKVLGAGGRAARAQAVYDQFLTPTRDSQTLQKLLQVHGALSSPVDHTALNTAASAGFAGAAPVAFSQLLSQGQQQ